MFVRRRLVLNSVAPDPGPLTAIGIKNVGRLGFETHGFIVNAMEHSTNVRLTLAEQKMQPPPTKYWGRSDPSVLGGLVHLSHKVIPKGKGKTPVASSKASSSKDVEEPSSKAYAEAMHTSEQYRRTRSLWKPGGTTMKTFPDWGRTPQTLAKYWESATDFTVYG